MNLLSTRLRRHSRALTALAAGALVVASGIAAAPTASATATVNVSCMAAAPSTSVPLPLGESLTIAVTQCAHNEWGPAPISWTSANVLTSLVGIPGTIPNGTNLFTAANVGTTTIQIQDGYLQTMATITVTVVAPGSGGTTAAPAPVVAPVSFGGADSGLTCADAPANAVEGTWVTVPAKCAGPAAPAGATLLGWATTVDFPVAIAQRQAANNWGAYELTDADGAVVSVYVPAGWGTLISGSTNLYPVWSK